jgi:hypothetical protein
MWLSCQCIANTLETKAGWYMWVGGAVQSNELDTFSSPSLAPLRLEMVTPAKRS